MPNCDFGLIGLAVMGENLALNIESRGYKVCVFNRTTSVVDKLIAGPRQGQELRRLPFRRGAGQESRAPAQSDDDGQGRRRRSMT